MQCDQARTEIIAYLKNELDSGKRERLEEHLARCPNCRHELEGARRLLSWTEAASEQTVVRLVEEVIDNAIKCSASDVHFEPQRDNTLLVRIRVDGVLHEAARLDVAQRAGAVARIKMMAEMDVSETRLPQDGRMPWKFDDRDFDIRVNCTPFVYGEGIVMRILDRSRLRIGLDKLTLFDDHLHAIRELIRQPTGMVFVSGPTGSGKTNTLYSMLQELVSPAVKVMTIEDPVEYMIEGVEHGHVVKKIGFTFPNALRSFARHDPDVIMVGEVRDYETAVIVTELAITGHMVLCALHTNDAIGVIQRLRDMGIEDFIIAACLTGALSQRLARSVCQSCKTRLTPDSLGPAAKALGITPEEVTANEVYVAKGCEECYNTGYKGRIVLFEVLTIDRDLASMIGQGCAHSEILEAARAKGFITLADDARRKILKGLTTAEEAARVLSHSTL